MKSPVLSLMLIACLAAGCSESTESSPGGAGASNAAGSGGSTAGAAGAAGAGVAGMAGTAGAAGAAGMGDAGGGGASGAGGSGGAGGSQAPAPMAPQLDMLMPMQGALHVMWTNKQADCDTIEGERKTDTEPYAVAFTVPGEADNKHDTSATMDMTYTYRLRCKKGDTYSDYSNEKSRNPKK